MLRLEIGNFGATQTYPTGSRIRFKIGFDKWAYWYFANAGSILDRAPYHDIHVLLTRLLRH